MYGSTADWFDPCQCQRNEISLFAFHGNFFDKSYFFQYMYFHFREHEAHSKKSEEKSKKNLKPQQPAIQNFLENIMFECP